MYLLCVLRPECFSVCSGNFLHDLRLMPQLFAVCCFIFCTMHLKSLQKEQYKYKTHTLQALALGAYAISEMLIIYLPVCVFASGARDGENLFKYMIMI